MTNARMRSLRGWQKRVPCRPWKATESGRWWGGNMTGRAGQTDRDGRRQTETKRLTDWVSFWVEHTKPKSSEDSTQIFCQITFQQPFAVTVSLSLRVGSLFKILFSRGSPQMLVFMQGLDNQLLYQRVSKIKL